SVADAALTAGTVSASGGIEGVSPTSLTATFSDANHGAPTSDFSGTINWGDGHTTSFTSADVSGSGGKIGRASCRESAEEAVDSITVNRRDVGGQSTRDSGSIRVGNVTGVQTCARAICGIEGVSPTSLTATFSDANHGAPTSDFSGTINWGDGHTTSFTSADVSGSGG